MVAHRGVRCSIYYSSPITVIGPREVDVKTFLGSNLYLLEATVKVTLAPVGTFGKLKNPSELVDVLNRAPDASVMLTTAFRRPRPPGVATWPESSIVELAGEIVISLADAPAGELKSYSRTLIRPLVVLISGTVKL